MKRILGYLSVLLLALAVFTSLLPAQTALNGDLTGTVTDPQGAVVPNAQVELKSLQTGETQTAVTNSQGQYRFSLLKPGGYSATVNAAGFQATTQNASVNLGQVTNLNIKAGLAGTATSIEVTTEAPLLQADNANLSTTFNSAQIDNLPAPGGDTTSYAFTAPGVTLSTGAGYGNFSAYGLPGTSNLFTINGNDNMDPYLNLNNSGASNLTLGANEVQEVAVVENGYSVQYGRQAGAQVNSVTKSGTNQYHGNASYWYNAGGFNANDYYNNSTTPKTPRPHAVNNSYAASLGGHIIKDKLFFFADHEGLRYVLPGSANPVNIPTAAFANYTLGNLGAVNPGAVPFYQRIFNLYGAAPGAGRATPNADATNGCGPDFASTTAGAAFIGASNFCTSSFIPTNNNLNTEWLISARVDYNISSKDSVFVRYRTDHGVQATGTDPISPLFNAFSNQPEDEAQLTETHIFGSTATNQFILSGSHYKAIFGPQNLAAALAAFPTTLLIGDTPVTQLGGSDNNYPQGRKVTQWMIVDDFSKTRGNHDWKFGANFRRNDVSDFAYGPNTSGTLSFGSLVDFSNGALGTSANTASRYSQRFSAIGGVPIALYSLAGYLQDQWKPTSNLSITYGLRVDRNANPTCRVNCFARLAGPFSTVAADPTGTTPYNSLIRTGLKNGFSSIQVLNLQPRIGIAYSVRPHTVIRTGIGMFSDLFPGTLIDRFITQPPNVATFTTDPASTANVIPGDPNSVFAAVANSNAAFRSGFANGASYSTLKATVPGFSRPSLATMANKLANPTQVEYNFEIEQGIGNRLVGSLNYVGNYGYDEFNLNPLGNAFSLTGAPFGGLPTKRPVAGFNTVNELNNHGYSNYNGITGALRGRFGNYLNAGVSYTYSKGLDTCSNNCILPYNFNTAVGFRNQVAPGTLGQLNYGPSDYDTRNSINANYVISAPKNVINGFVSRILGGWTVAGTVYFHSGYPFSVFDSSIPGGVISSAGAYTGQQYLATFIGGLDPGHACTSPTKACFGDGSAFVAPGSETGFGNLHRNSFRGPMYFNTDMNVTKNIKLTERFTFGIGANFFNILNHPNFDLPCNDISSGVCNATFGVISNTVSAPTSPYGAFSGSSVSGRVVQLNAHIIF